MKWFPTEANERRAHVSENIPGANERHPPIKWFPTGANGRRAHVLENILEANGCHRPIKWFSTEANGRRPPPSDVRVGAQKHTPPIFPVGNNSAQQASAAIGFHFIGGWASTAAVGFVPYGVI